MSNHCSRHRIILGMGQTACPECRRGLEAPGIPPAARLYCHPCRAYRPYSIHLGDILCECGYIFATLETPKETP